MSAVWWVVYVLLFLAGGGAGLWWWLRRVMWYRVYLWKTCSSVEAEIVAETWALCADMAIQQVMRRAGCSYVSYAWVVAAVGCSRSVERWAVSCHIPMGGREGSEGQV
jgi:hypothetical protein